MMTLQFKKGKDHNTTLTCLRSDGSSTWTKLNPQLGDHDLAHFAVESVLGFKEAFYGLLNQGFEAGDFELPRNQRPDALLPKNLPVEALQTEHLVNLLQTEYWNTGEKLDLIPMLANILATHKLPFPAQLTPSSLEAIRQKYHELSLQWRQLKAGETLELELKP